MIWLMPKLLAIDDEPDFTEMIKNFFEPRGYKVFTADRGETGLEIAVKEDPDVALVDYKMPGIHGDEVLTSIRKMKLKSKVIIITAFQDDGKTKERLLSLGAFACLDKPLSSLMELEGIVRKALAA